MAKNIVEKCEHLRELLTSNLYIQSEVASNSIDFIKLEIPHILEYYVHNSVEKLLTQHQKQRDICLYTGPFKLCYLIMPAEGSVIYGPFVMEQLSSEEIRYIGYTMKLSSQNWFILESFFQGVPFYSKEQITRIASVAFSYLTTSDAQEIPHITCEDHSHHPIETHQPLIEHTFESFDFVEANYAAEDKVMQAIEHGDIAYIEEIVHLHEHNSGTASFTGVPERVPENSIRDKKNLAITMNSLAARSARKGGLSTQLTHSISHNFAIRIEEQRQSKSMAKLLQEMLITYTKAVRAYGLRGKSDLVIRAVTHIRSRITEPMGLSDIAGALNVSKEHLSRQFAKEMGTSITDFIHKTKVEESCNILTTGRYSISDIAYTFGYAYPSHYTRVFKKCMGVSPKQYQLRQPHGSQ